MFFLAVHPDAWSVRFDEDGDGLLLPSLRQIKAAPGVDGVSSEISASGAVTVKWRPAANKAQDRGWTLIPHDKGPGGHSYLRRIVVPGGHAHVTCFDRVYAGSDVIECDRRAIKEWIDALCAAKTIPGPSPVALRRELAALSGQSLSLSAKAATNPVAATRVEKIGEMIKIIRAELDKHKAARGPAITGDIAPSLED